MDYIIKNGTVYDGLGSSPQKTDILIKDHRIEAIGHFDTVQAPIIDASNKLVTPGFIDLHRHCDLAIFGKPFGFVELAQGITTCFGGNCGMSAVPTVPQYRAALLDYLSPCLGQCQTPSFTSHATYVAALQNTLLPLHYGFFAGLGALRIAVAGFDPTPLRPKQMDQIKELLRDALSQGAFGLSIGLMYLPEAYFTLDELVEIISVLRGRGILVCHMRHETALLPEAVAEMIDIATRSEVAVQISHFKAAGKVAHQKQVLAKAIAMIENARATGLDLTVDVYPYDCGASTMMQLIPPAFLTDGVLTAMKRLERPQGVAHLRRLLSEKQSSWDPLGEMIGYERIFVTGLTGSSNRHYIGKSLAEITQIGHFSDIADCLATLLREEGTGVSIILQSMRQSDIDMVVRLPYSMLISDALYGDDQNPHPRLMGSFPKFLRQYAWDRKLLSTEVALQKMTSMPANRLNLSTFGRITPGATADLLVIDPKKFTDQADYQHSTKLSVGPDQILLRGQLVFEHQTPSLEKHGLLLQNGKSNVPF